MTTGQQCTMYNALFLHLFDMYILHQMITSLNEHFFTYPVSLLFDEVPSLFIVEQNTRNSIDRWPLGRSVIADS
jgi:hypothetical protein